MININQIKYINLLPPNFKNAHNKALSKTIETEFLNLIQNIKYVNIYSNIDNLEGFVLDHLALQMRVDGYLNSFNIQTKRLLIKNSLIYFMKMGTKAAIEDKVTAIFGDGTVIEWFEESAATFTFKVETTNQNANESMADEFARVIKSVKNARSVLSEVVVKLTDPQKTYIGNIIHISDNFILRQVNS